MPHYDYKCRKCHKVFEVEQRITEAPLKTHPGCGGVVHRLLTPPAIHFKGSGFHVTDYRKDAPKSESASKTETKLEAKAAPTGGTGTDSKS